MQLKMFVLPALESLDDNVILVRRATGEISQQKKDIFVRMRYKIKRTSAMNRIN